MIELHFCTAQRTDETLFGLLQSKTGAPPRILRTANGKPYLEGDPLFFSVTHSGEYGAVALSGSPVGADMEIYRQKEHPSVLRRFCAEEQKEISCERDFLIHWTVREAFVKFKGGTLATMLKSIAYYGGNLYFEDKIQAVEIDVHSLGYGILSVCTGR